MIFVQCPSLMKDISKWHAYLKYLECLCPHDETVISEKQRVQSIINFLENNEQQ